MPDMWTIIFKNDRWFEIEAKIKYFIYFLFNIIVNSLVLVIKKYYNWIPNNFYFIFGMEVDSIASARQIIVDADLKANVCELTFAELQLWN